jgi:hypothetical protein
VDELGRIAVGDEANTQQERQHEYNGDFGFPLKTQLHHVRS